MSKIQQFKELGDLKKEESVHKPIYEKKKRELRDSEITKVETSFNQFFEANGFAISKEVNRFIATYNGQSIVLELHPNKQSFVIRGKINIEKNEYLIGTIVENQIEQSEPINPTLPEDEKQFLILKRDVDYYKNFDFSIYKFKYFIRNKQKPQQLLTINSKHVQQLTGDSYKEFGTFEELLNDLMS